MSSPPNQTPIQCDCVQWWKTREGRVWFALFAVGLLLTRMAFLGIHSPWNDEVANWSWASQLPGGVIEKKHWLTYWTIWLFTRVHDSIFFVRLPMMLIASFASLLFASVVWNHFKAHLGKAVVLLLLFNPMLTFYSIDANHYAYVFFSGVVCSICSLYVGKVSGWKQRILLIVGCVGVLGFLCQAHPFALLPIVGFGGVLLVDLFLRPTLWLGTTLSKASEIGKILSVGIGIVATIAGVLVVQRLQEGIYTVPLKNGFYFTLTPTFLSSLVANFYGAYFEFHLIDYCLGITAIIACVLGFVFCAKSFPGVGYMGICGLFQACVIGYFFTTIEAVNYFHIRYIIFLLPTLLLGVALFATHFGTLAKVVRLPESSQPQSTFLREVNSLLIPFLILRWVSWAVSFYSGHFQPLVPALTYISEKLPKDSIVGTRSEYLAQSYRFLTTHYSELSGIEVELLGKSYPVNQIAASRAQYLALTQDRPVFLLEMKAYDNQLSQAYHDYAGNQPLLKTFSSSAPRDFYPYDRTLELRSVPKNADFGRLPILGSAAIQVFPQNPTSKFYPSEVGEPFTQLLLSPGSGASYYLQKLPEETKSFWVDLLLSPTETDDVLLMGILEPQGEVAFNQGLETDDQTSSRTLLLWTLKEEKGPFSLEVPALINSDFRLTLFYCKNNKQSTPANQQNPNKPLRNLLIEGIRNVDPGFIGLSPRVIPFSQSSLDGVVLQCKRTIQWEADDLGSDQPKTTTFTPKPADNGALMGQSVDLQSSPEVNVLVLYHFETTGLSSQGIGLQVVQQSTYGKQTQQVLGGYQTPLTFGPAWAGIMIPAHQKVETIDAVYQLLHQKVVGPQFGHLTVEEPRFFMIKMEFEKTSKEINQ